MLERFFNWIRMVTQKMFGTTNFYTKAGVPPNAVTDEMVQAIDRWCNLYENKAPWLSTDTKSLSLPSRIAAEVAMMVTVEMEMKVTGEGTNAARVAYLNEQVKDVMETIQKQTEYACAKGGLVFKPYPDDTTKSIFYDYIQADDFYPCTFNSKDEITSAIFLSRKKEGHVYFTRVEKHTLDGTNYTIANRAFRCMNDSDIGDECSLTDVVEWASIEPLVEIKDIEVPLFAYFKIPLGNTVDPKSPLGVSVYARVDQSGLLEQADKQFQRLMWEFEGGELAIDASRDAFKTVKGVPELPTGKERLFRANELTGSGAGNELLKTFSPALRDTSFTSGLQTVLKQIEDNCGLSRGTLSDADFEARTATEIKMSRQRTYATVTSIQRSLQKALTTLVKATDVLATLYGYSNPGKYELSFIWDDSVIVDAEAERQRDMGEVGQGLMQKWEYRKKWYGEDEATAKAMVAQESEKTEDELMGFGLPNKQPIENQSVNTEKKQEEAKQ